MIRFDGEVIKCADAHTGILARPSEAVAVRNYFFGLEGVSELIGKPEHDGLVFACWLNDASFAGANGSTALLEYLDKLREMRGRHGILEQLPLGNHTGHTYKNVTFDGFDQIQLPGQDHPEIFPDYTQMFAGSWIAAVSMKFTQLRVA